MSKIGFVTVTYSEPNQLLRLTKRLGSMFPGAKISAAHDFGQTHLDTKRFPDFVSFIHPYEKTKWGNISVIHAAMRALRELYEKDDPDWVVLLSGSDYPVTSADKILSELRTGSYDAYIDFREIIRPHGISLSADNREASFNFTEPEWNAIGYDRYVAKLINYPSLTRKLQPKWRKIFIRHPWFAWPFHPFRTNLHCFGGEQWFTANRRTAHMLIDEYESGERLIKHFSKCFIPEEGYYQTVICNGTGLRVSSNNKRYIDWGSGGGHPKLLGSADLPAIAASGSHFARKFRPDDAALSLLDKLIEKK